MADAKITALTALTDPAVADILPIVDDVAGTPITKKVTLQAIADLFAGLAQTLVSKTLTSPLFQGTVNGWVLANETWTRESDNSFSEPIDATLKYRKDDKIRYKQGGAYKYQYVVGVGAYSGGKTIITTTAGTDYIFTTGTAITDNYYSHAQNPIGFPDWFTCAAPVWALAGIDNASGGQPTAGTTIFRIFNSCCQLRVSIVNPSAKVGAGSIISFTKPLTLPNLTDGGLQVIGSAVTTNNNNPAVCLYKSSTEVYISLPASVADNQDMQFTSCDATWRY